MSTAPRATGREASCALLGITGWMRHSCASCHGLRSPRKKRRDSSSPLLLPLDYTALIAYNDYVAYHCLNDFRMHGVQVPRDISMVSFDHILRYNSSFPLLNSVTAREETVSEVAVRVLLEQIQHSETENQNIVLPITVHDDGTVVDCPGA